MIKLQILRGHGLKIEKEDVVDAVMRPDGLVKGRRGRFISQKVYDEKHFIRVVYEVEDEKAFVVTLYPARRERYEGQV